MEDSICRRERVGIAACLVAQLISSNEECGKPESHIRSSVQIKARLARTTIELDHFNGECWTGSKDRKNFQDMDSQHILACL